MNWNASPAVDKVVQDQALEFQKTHPGTKVNITLLPYDQYAQKLPLLVAGGTPPDIFAMSDDIMRFVQEGRILALDEFVQDDPVLSDPQQTRVHAYDIVKFQEGHVYGQPASLCSMQLYYNRDLFDKAGVAYPDENWTWDDFVGAAQKLTIREGEQTTQWGADLGYLTGWDGGWQAVMAASGGKWLDTNFNPDKLYLDAPEVIGAWQFIQDLVHTHKVVPGTAARDAMSQAGGPFQSGKVAMVPDGCWMLSSYKEAIPNLGMNLLPKGTAGRAHPAWSEGFVISQDSKNKALAWEYLRWLSVDQKANEMAASTGNSCGAPLVKKFDDLFATAWKDVPGGEACVRSLDTGTFFRIFHANYTQILDTVLMPEWEKFMEGKVSAREFSTAVNDKANQMLK